MASTLKDYFNTGDTNWDLATNTRWQAMVFTATSSYAINSVKLLLFRTNSPGTITVSIKALDIDGKPTGADLASGTTDGDTLTTNTSGEWREITFGAPYSITAFIQYAVVIRSSQPLDNRLNCRDNGTNDYATGYRIVSTDSGSTWSTISTARDMLFEAYDIFNPPTSGPDITSIRRLVAAANSKIWYEDI